LILKRIFIPVLMAMLIVGGALLFVGCDEPGRTTYPEPNARRPFPHRDFSRFANPPALPSNISQTEMEERIISLFRNILRNNIIVDSNSPQNKDEFRIVFQHRSSSPGGGPNNLSNITVSESHGYGMMILALMAGSEHRLGLQPEEWLFGGDIKDYFDAMLRTMQRFPAQRLSGLFAWRLWGYGGALGANRSVYDADPYDPETNPTGIQWGGFREVNGVKSAPFVREPGSAANSATDGDMDIIYALILADRQWGSDGRYDYLQTARGILGALYNNCIHPQFNTLLLGDWAKSTNDPVQADTTRASDFMLSHLVTFRDIDTNPNHDWQAVIDATLNVIWEIRSSQNALGAEYQNGLLPDFIIRQDGRWVVPGERILEGGSDGFYHWNSVRVPWRMGTAYMLFGDMPSGESTLYDLIIAPLDNFARTRPDGLFMGSMYLNGVNRNANPGPSQRIDFPTPFVVTAAARGNHPDQWIDEFWRDENAIPNGMHHYHNNVFGDYFRLISLITASGNYWIP